jgi:hypothetical protein
MGRPQRRKGREEKPIFWQPDWRRNRTHSMDSIFRSLWLVRTDRMSMRSRIPLACSKPVFP